MATQSMRWPFGATRQVLYACSLVLLRMVAFGAIVFGLLRPWAREAGNQRGTSTAILSDLILAVVAVLFAVAMLRGVARADPSSLGFSSVGWRKNLAVGVGVFLAGLLLIGVRLLLEGQPLSDMAQAASSYSASERLQLILIGVHVVFGEELLFRGYLQPGLAARWGQGLAIVVTALVFALYHVDFRPLGFAGNFAWGLLWGAARARTGSTIPSSVAHFGNWAILGWL